MSVSNKELLEYKESTKATYKEMAKKFGKSPEAIRSAVRRSKKKRDKDKTPPPKKKPTFKEENGKAVADSVGSSIITLDALLKTCKVDLSIWEVEQYIINKWPVVTKNRRGEPAASILIQVKAWLKPRKIAPFEKALETLTKDLGKKSPTVKASKPTGDHLLLINLFDAHFNKRSANGNWSLEKAKETFIKTGLAILARAKALPYSISEIVIASGNDLFHVDNLIGTTTKGTLMETVSHQELAISAVTRALVAVIDAAAKLAPVRVVSVESNHDRYSIVWLAKWLEAWYKNNKQVTIDASAMPYKFYRYGKNLLGFDHGDTMKAERLALVMADQVPKDWAKSEYREWLRGHLHKRGQMFYPATEETGVNVRMIPALCPPDKWHQARGFIGNKRAGEALLYHREHGPAGSFPVFVDEIDK
jgi:hypothetical protein